MKKVPVTVWRKCYPSKWGKLIVRDAFKHPAKYSNLLIRRIYNHLFEEGWIVEGDSVIDPFGGVALGALDAMRLGLVWRGVELEKHFVETGGQNIALWNKCFSSLPHWNQNAVLLNGDSRKLIEILKNERQTVAISSPPFGQAIKGGGIARSVTGKSSYPLSGGSARTKKAANSAKGFGYQNQRESEGNLSALPVTENDLQIALALSSPHKADSIKPGIGSGFNYRKAKGKTGRKKTDGRESIAKGYGVEQGNLGVLNAGDFSLAVSSPPFLQSSGGLKVSKGMDQALIKRHAAGNAAASAYGQTDGQLSNFAEGDFEIAVSSPPFENNTEGVLRSSKFKNPRAFVKQQKTKGHYASPEARLRATQEANQRAKYGNTSGNVGNDSGENFWSAARVIVDQVYNTLKPGGHAVWVVKDFVKGGKRVPFCAQWRALCEAVGFETLHEHHAELVKDGGTSNTLDGGKVSHLKSSKSFFHRVSERNTALRNYWRTLSPAMHTKFMEEADKNLWNSYNSLTVLEREERDEEGNLVNEPPTGNAILKAAQEKAFEVSGEALIDWNRDIAIDYETVYCMIKPVKG